MEVLEKIDLIRERLNVSYKKAKEALETADGDVVKALINLEDDFQSSGESDREDINKDNIYKVKGQKLLDKIKNIIKEGNVSKISVKNKENETLVEIPVTAGVISLVLFPYIGILAGLGAMYKEYTLEIEKTVKKKQDNSENSQAEYYPFE
ncbi:MAG: DUF4342 domain-containing protein [Bacillota bacterium]